MDYKITRSNGFTLLELLIIILILIILTIVVGSKVFGAKAETNSRVLESMGGAIMSAGKMVYAKAMIQGLHRQPLTTIDLDGDGTDDVEIAYGWPSASRGNGISKIMDDEFEELWTWSTTFRDTRFWLTTASLGGRSGQYVNRSAVLRSGCYITYDPATSNGDTPTVSYVFDEC